ncbi:MAG: UvrB/UvrC motif-containing protein [Candidatus Caldatribacteriota bacterium]
MLCQICKKKEATIMITQVIGGEKTELHLCKDCATLFGDKFSIISFPQFNLDDLLSGLLKAFDLYSQEEGRMAAQEIKCSNCGLTYQDFMQTGKLGCSICYQDFRGQLLPLLRRLHGNSEHIGKVPLQAKNKLDKINQIKRLRKELQEVVIREDYERAAQIRDEILKLEGVTKKKDAR